MQYSYKYDKYKFEIYFEYICELVFHSRQKLSLLELTHKLM